MEQPVFMNHSSALFTIRPSFLKNLTKVFTFFRTICIILLLLLIYRDVSPQGRLEDKKALLKRAVLNLPEVKSSPKDGAPGYCPSGSHSTTYESINSVNIKEIPTGLEVTVVVNITNPYNCVPNEPCWSYDASPENINVWIDWDGDKTWGNRPDEYVIHEGLKGYAIGFNKHLMSYTQNVNVPADAKKPTWMRVNLGWGHNPTDPCEQYWTYGDVKDYSILWGLKIKEISAIGNINLADVPKFRISYTYDKDGILQDFQADTPLVAAARQSEVKLHVKLQSFPDDKLGDNSRTVCNYKITSPGRAYINDVSEFKGKEGNLAIKLPSSIGKYDLILEFKFYGENQNQIGQDSYTVNLWVSYGSPQLGSIKKVWLDKAIKFTEGVQISPNVEDQLAREMMNGIYSRGGMQWAYTLSTTPWFNLVEGKSDIADCKATANVWMNLLNVLGVGGTSTVRHAGKKYGDGFLSVTGLVAYGGKASAKGNAWPNPSINNYDRWVFESHTFGKKGAMYYDPVFNQSSSNFFYHVEYDISKRYKDWYQTGDPPGSGPAIHALANEAFSPEEGSWPTYMYVYLPKYKAHGLFKQKLAEGAKFTGSFSEKSINNDGDPYIDQLSSDVEVDITKSGMYSVFGVLRQDSTIIAAQPYDGSPSVWFEAIGPNAGKVTIHPTFSGERIYQKKLNGIYTFDLYIVDTAGIIIDSALFSSKSHQYTEFGEIPVRISQLTEAAVDTSGDGFFDAISIGMNVQSSLAGSYIAQTCLYKDSTTIASASIPLSLSTGSNQVTLKLRSGSVSAYGKDGPYTLSLILCSTDGTPFTSDTMKTAAYKASQFTPPNASITQGTNEYTKDEDNDGLIDTLQVELQMSSLQESKYILTAYLTSQKDSFISVSSSDVSALKGSNLFTLNFAGTAIAKSKTDGPYKIGYAVILDTMLNLVSSGFNLYNTRTYTINQFEQPRGRIIQSTGTYSAKLIDSDNNGLTDSLEIDVQVIPLDTGYVVAMGQLMNSEGESVCWASGRDFLPANETGDVRLKFNGRMIYGSLSDGPYELKNLLIYHLGIPEESISIENAFKTPDYKYLNFEKAPVVTGLVTDVNNKPVKGVLLSLGDSTYDYSEPTGKYHLVSMQDGQFLLKIFGPDTTGLVWNISQGDKLFTGDSLIVNVSKDTVLTVNFKAPIVLSDVQGSKQALIALPYYDLMQNYPNPFNPATTIRYNIPQAGLVKLEVYDMLGKKIATLVDEFQTAGMHERVLKADNLASGIYYYQIRSGGYMAVKKMILIK